MKLKLLAATLLACSLMSAAAPWDGTKGNVTVSTTSAGGWTHIAVNSTDRSVKDFIVTVYLKGISVWMQNDAHPGSAIVIPLIDIASKGLLLNQEAPATANFWCEIGQVAMVTITEVKAGQYQMFSAQPPTQ